MVNFLGEMVDKIGGQDEITQHSNYNKLVDDFVNEELGLPIKRDPFNPAPLLDLFKQYHNEIDKMANKSMGLMVKDDETLELATTMTTQAKALNQTIEKKRVEVKAPYHEVIKVLDGETKGLKDRLAQIQGHINQKITPYLQKKERERREAERLAQEEAARIQKEADEKARLEREKAADEARKAAELAGMNKQEAEQEAQAAAAMVEDAPVIVAQTVEETAVKTETGTAKLKEEWSFEIVNIKELPDRAFEARKAEVIKALSPWVNAQIKAGSRSVPGVKIFKVAKVKTRTNKNTFQF